MTCGSAAYYCGKPLAYRGELSSTFPMDRSGPPPLAAGLSG